MSEASYCDDFRCYICFQWPNKATLCTKCSNVCCRKCITDWVTSNYSCPMCQAAINKNDLVNCGWHDDIRSALEEKEDHISNLEFTIKEKNMLLKEEQNKALKLTQSFSNNNKILEKEKNGLMAVIEKRDKYIMMLTKNANEKDVEIRNLEKRVNNYESDPMLKYLKEFEHFEVLSKNKIGTASKQLLLSNVEHLSFKMMNQSLLMYKHFKSKEVVPPNVTLELDSMTELMNDFTLELKKK